MKRVDKRGSWMINTSQFRMHDPISDTYFESGEQVQATDTSWRQANKAIIKLTDDEGNLIDDPDLVVEQPAEAEQLAEPKGEPKPKVDTVKK